MLRNLLVISVVGLAAGASYAQDTCDPDTFVNACASNTTVSFCDDTTNPAAPVTGTADCTFPDDQGTAVVPGGTCGDLGCADTEGDGCTAFEIDGLKTCNAGTGDPCLGISPLVDTDTANDNQAGGILCTGASDACIISGTGETCAGGFTSCTDFGLDCSGNTLVLCLFGASEDDDNSGAINGTEDKDADNVVDSFVFTTPTGIDCATAFQGATGSCNATATAGPLHDLLGASAAGQALPDCEVEAAGEGEGEGEGDDAACTEDSQCGRDRVCNAGVCEAAEDPTEEAPTCAAAGSAMAPLAGLLLLVGPVLRRRRRN